MKGVNNNYPDFNLLINQFSPHIIALQKTLLPDYKTAYTPHKYYGYFHYLPQNKITTPGAALFIKKKQIKTQTYSHLLQHIRHSNRNRHWSQTFGSHMLHTLAPIV